MCLASSKENVEVSCDTVFQGYATQEAHELLHQQKLVLVVDLDQTLIDSSFDAIVHEWMNKETSLRPFELKDVEHFTIEPDFSPIGGKKSRRTTYYVKPRPGVHEFLQRASRIFVLHAFTAGTRQYAEKVLKIIDPYGHYFRTRLVTRDETFSLESKDLTYISLNPEVQRLCIIIDDRADVWGWPNELVKVTPYTFWQDILLEAERLKDNEQVPNKPFSNIESSHVDESEGDNPFTTFKREPLKRAQHTSENDWCASDQVDNQVLEKLSTYCHDDNELEHLGHLLSRMHTDFFCRIRASQKKRSDGVDTGLVVGTAKLHILKDFSIAFLDRSNPRSEIWFWAESFGASVSTKITHSTTHVVAFLPKSKRKILAAVYGTRAKVVWPGWLYACMARWMRVDETPFLFPNLPALLEDEYSLLSERNWRNLSPQVLTTRQAKIDFFRVQANLDELDRGPDGKISDQSQKVMISTESEAAINENEDELESDSKAATTGSDDEEEIDACGSCLELTSDSESDEEDTQLLVDQENKYNLVKCALRSVPSKKSRRKSGTPTAKRARLILEANESGCLSQLENGCC